MKEFHAPWLRTRWLWTGAAIAVGLVAGLGLYTFAFAKGASYLGSDPRACANCHVMNEYYAAWTKGSHRTAAVCNDCHAPHTLVGKYATKAENGFWHSLKFTTGDYPDQIRIRERNARVTEQACRSCHQPIVDAIDPAPAAVASARTHADARLDCTSCHQYVGHWVR